MFGLTEFEIHNTTKGWIVKLITGKNGTTVMESKKVYKDKHSAYNAAERWWNRMIKSVAEQKNLLPVRFA